jgi:hypothetical protein
VDLMVHEPFLAFAGSWRQQAAAAVHRLMTVTILGAARHVWVSTPAWRSLLEPYARRRPLGFEWLPIPSPVEPVDDRAGAGALRARFTQSSTRVVMGHFGCAAHCSSVRRGHESAAPCSGLRVALGEERSAARWILAADSGSRRACMRRGC